MNVVFPQMTGQGEAQAVLDTEAAAAAAEPAEGDALFVVSNKWFSQWCQYAGFVYDPARKKPKVVPQQEPGPRPGPIDNSDLLAERPPGSDLTEEQAAGVVALRDRLADKVHFWLLHEPTWKLLKEWYGCQGPEIRRQFHLAGRRLQLDAQQQHFRVVARAVDGGETEAVVGASTMVQLSNLKAMACKALGLEAEELELFDYRGRQQGANLETISFKTLTGARLQDQQALLLLPKGQAAAGQEAAGPSGAAASSSPVLMLPLPSSPLALSPRGSGGLPGTSPMSPLSRSFDRAPSWADDVVYEAAGRARGLAGLGNLGNTCFMNSSLQCLAHSPPLMQTFLTGAYRRDLNKDNPLSLGGKLALAFGALMEKLWAGGVGHVSPKLFKWQLAKFAPQFSGYAQQDSQELLAFLLDGLHEDLNRITDKPYVEDKDSDGRPDAEVAAEAWHNYRRRNDSVIVDAFQGLYRSVLTCPDCANQSVKFDPLMYLSLPLPSSKMRSFVFTAVYVDGSAPPRRYGVDVPKSATVGQLSAAVGELLGLPGATGEGRLLLAQFNMDQGAFEVYADDKARVSSIEDLKSRSFLSSRGGLYLAYVYPSVQAGPRGGGLPIHLTSRSSTSWLIPATPLFVPRERLEGLSAEPRGGENVVAAGAARDAVDAALEQLLRPFRKHSEPEPAMMDSSEQQQQQADEPAPMDEARAGAEEAHPEPAGLAAGPIAAQDCEAMDAEAGPTAGPLPTTPNGTAYRPGGDAAWLDGMQTNGATPAAADGDDDGAPFDMWAAQKEDAAKAAAAALEAAASRPPFLLKCAKRNGYGPGVNTYAAALEAPEEGEPLLLLAEWQEAAAALYDPQPLLAAERDASAVALAERQRDGGKSVTLADCLETFLQPEQLDAEDSWYCGRCKAHVRADKKLDLWALPDVLVVHLKRFSYSRYSRDKLDTVVDFPLRELDMARYLPTSQQPQQGQAGGGTAPSTRYDLYAVSNHYGGMGGGHYTAYCRVPGEQGGWYSFDDSHVGRMEEAGVKTSAAYVLFYRRQGAQAGEDVEALLQRAAEQQQQQLAEGLEERRGDAAEPPLPPPLPAAPGSALGKRQPETIEEEEEEEGGDTLADDIPAAGAIEID